MLREYIECLLMEEVDRMIQRSAGTFMPAAPGSPTMFSHDGPLGDEEPLTDEQTGEEINGDDFAPKYHQTVAAARRIKQVEKA